MTTSSSAPAAPAACWPIGCRADPNIEVLLIEAGGRDKSMMIHMPAGIPALIGKPNPYNWYYQTEGQQHLNGRSLYWPRGRGWGGSSSINGMIYIRGHARDYDGWRQLGLDGWSFADVLPYFKRAEHNENGGDDFHGGEGPLRVSNGRSSNPLFRAFMQAGMRSRLSARRRISTASSRKASAPISSRSTRAGAGARRRAISRPFSARKNLTIESNAHVSRILFDGTRVNGVEFIQNKQTGARDRDARSAAFRRRGEQPADAAAVGHRRSGDPQALRHSGRRRAQGRRQEPAGSSRRVDPVRKHASRSRSTANQIR